MTILETRKKINEINAKYDSKVADLKIQTAKLETQRKNELGDLPAQYDAQCSEIIEKYENGIYSKQPGVVVRTTKSVVITDETKVPAAYMKYVVDDKKIKSDMNESDYTMKISGVKVVNKYSVVVTLK